MANLDSDWKEGFLFVGNQLALDFLNTRPTENGQSIELLPDFNAFLRWLKACGLLKPGERTKIQQRWGGSASARMSVEAVRALRERLRTEIQAWEAGAAVHRSTIEELNRLMAAYPMRTRLKPAPQELALEQWFKVDRPDDLFAPLADAAATLFASFNRERVRKCAECALHFHDVSRKGDRRWCSMQLCGNRRKVAAYAARLRLH